MTHIVEIVRNTPVSLLGESPIWHPQEKVLYWVDIIGKKLYRYNIQNKESQTFDMKSMIGTVVPARGRYSVIVALETGIYGLTSNGKLEKLSEYPENEMENNRFNDGKCDPTGRFWVGTMNKNVVKKAGNLYTFDGNKFDVKQPKVTISNGLAWSSDFKTMYYIDSYEYAISAYDFNNLNGQISNRRIAVRIPKNMGVPDGMTIDSKGMLWVAHWGGSAVRCWNPESGEMIDKINIPAPHVTACTFGNQDINTLYVTTATEGLSKIQYRNYPLSGSLFKIQLNIKGSSNFIFSTHKAIPIS